ncbi:hypothetical protein BC937DRAFT_86264 [Endogone sp. FLAS-F59071]|nr:hypothetical protein BC937DRAFT_86264 [Endogone sp. FLAS-F59071]|eukprot:RUS20154.1 hypothetical protein BC937DRAFT_86264 [Endogone sp. FLAS-F59071]
MEGVHVHDSGASAVMTEGDVEELVRRIKRPPSKPIPPEIAERQQAVISCYRTTVGLLGGSRAVQGLGAESSARVCGGPSMNCFASCYPLSRLLVILLGDSGFWIGDIIKFREPWSFHRQ